MKTFGFLLTSILLANVAVASDGTPTTSPQRVRLAPTSPPPIVIPPRPPTDTPASKPVSSATAKPPKPDPVVPLTCPSQPLTDDTLNAFRELAIKSLLDRKPKPVLASLQTCFASGRPSCLDEVAYASEEHGETRYGAYEDEDDGRGRGGDSVSVEGLTLTSTKDLPEEFQSRGLDGKIIPGQFNMPKDLFKIAKAKGWKAISYKTRSTGGFDSAPNLTLVAIPGTDRDIYIQISPPPDRNSHSTRNNPHFVNDPTKGQNSITVITVDKTKSPPLGQLRLLSKNDSTGNYQWSNKTSSQSCTSCHTSPLRSISPRGYLVTNGSEKRLPKEDERTIAEINEMMLVPGLSWGTFPDGKTRRGPEQDSMPLGWAPDNAESRKDAFLKECSSNMEDVEYSSLDDDYTRTFKASKGASKHINLGNVRENMSCTGCHNGSVRGPLHDGFSSDEIAFKILVDRSMPPGANLNSDERLALYTCLMAERDKNQPIWAKKGDWLRKVACTTNSGGFTLRRRRAAPGSSVGTGNAAGSVK